MRVLSFDDFELGRGLTRAGRPIHLEPKQSAVLRYLLEASGRRVPIDELRSAVWDDVVVTSASVHTAVSALRRALDGAVLISGGSAGYRIHADVAASGPPGERERWRYYAAHFAGTVAERIAAANALTQAEDDKFGA